MSDHDSDEKLFRRLRRLVAAVHAMTSHDEPRRLLVLESDLRAVRAELHARCGLLVKKMDAAGAQLNAVAAYARGASLRRGASKSHTNKRAME
jgi:hypothetical protein